MGQADAEPTMVEEKVEKVEKEPGGRRKTGMNQDWKKLSYNESDMGMM